MLFIATRSLLVVAVAAVLVLVVRIELSAVYLVAWGGPVLNFHSCHALNRRVIDQSSSLCLD